ncbi:MAG: hypothetical protein IJ993_08525 [Akkermansia sp.]|nr:hypothetical protein [Akkermansia sp.]
MGLSGVFAMVVVSAVAAAQDAVPVGAVPPSVPQYAYASEQEGWFLAAVFWLYYVLVWLVAVAGVVMVAVLWRRRVFSPAGQRRVFVATDAAGAAVLLLSVAAYFFAYQWHVLLLLPLFCLAYWQRADGARTAEPAYMRVADACVYFASLGRFALLKPAGAGGVPRSALRWDAKLWAVLLLPLWVVFAPYWLALLCILGFWRNYATR